MLKLSSRALGGIVLNLALASAALLFSLFLADRALWMLGLPAPAQANPPHLSEVRKNIEFQYEFKTNSLGFRYKDIPLDKPKDVFRVYVAGDSFVEGLGVNAEETFSAVLERRYSRPAREIDFINGGFAGTGPGEYGEIFLKTGLKYHPDGLLLCVYANDVADSKKGLAGLSNPIKRRLYGLFPDLIKAWERFRQRPKPKGPNHPESRDMVKSSSEEALRRGVDPKRIEEWKESLPQDLVVAADRGEFEGGYLATGILNPLYWTESLDIDTALAESKWRHMVNAISRMVNECRLRRIEVAVVFIPCGFQYNEWSYGPDNPWILSGSRVRREWLTGGTELQRRMKAWAEKKKVPFLDMTPSLRKAVSSGNILSYTLDGHWNVEGNRAVAEILEDWIERERVFSGL